VYLGASCSVASDACSMLWMYINGLVCAGGVGRLSSERRSTCCVNNEQTVGADRPVAEEVPQKPKPTKHMSAYLMSEAPGYRQRSGCLCGAVAGMNMDTADTEAQDAVRALGS
jgi:hypothetical protein